MAQLELREDSGFLRREWRVQRWGWALIVCVVVAAVTGLLGYGPLSQAQVETANARVEYTRIVHRDRTDVMRISGVGSTLRLAGPWLDSVDIEQVIPEPVAMSADDAGLTMQFGSDQVKAVISYRATSSGLLRVTVDVGGPRLALTQVVLP